MEREESFYTTKAIAEYFKISRYAIIRAVKSGKLKPSKVVGNKYLFSETEIRNYLTSNIE